MSKHMDVERRSPEGIDHMSLARCTGSSTPASMCPRCSPSMYARHYAKHKGTS